MNREQVVKDIQNEIEKRGYEVSIKTTMKNGIEMEAFAFHGNEQITPLIYVNSFLKEAENGKSISKIAKEIIQIYQSNDGSELVEISRLMDKNFMISGLRMALQKESRENIIKKNCELDGLECYLYVSDDEKGYSFKVKEEHMPLLNMTIAEAFKVAEKQTFERSTILTMAEMLGLQVEDDGGMFVVSVESGFRGAVSVLNKRMIQSKMEELGNEEVREVLVLPSSINECIVIPMVDEMEDKSVYDEMVRQVNTSEVDATEVLANQCYVMQL